MFHTRQTSFWELFFSTFFRHFPGCQPFSIVAVIISLFPSNFNIFRHNFASLPNRFELPNTLKYGIGVAIASQGQILTPKHWPLLAHPQPGGRRATGSEGVWGGEAPPMERVCKKKVKKYDRAKLSNEFVSQRSYFLLASLNYLMNLFLGGAISY